MAHYYFDSSALVKLYVAETGTTWVRQLWAVRASSTLYTVRISGAEIVAALFLRARIGSLVLTDAQAAALRFREDLRTHLQVVEVTEQLVNRAMGLIEKHGLRGYDAIQLAAGLELQSARANLSLSPITFVCADDKLNQAAAAENLLVENPNAH